MSKFLKNLNLFIHFFLFCISKSKSENSQQGVYCLFLNHQNVFTKKRFFTNCLDEISMHFFFSFVGNRWCYNYSKLKYNQFGLDLYLKCIRDFFVAKDFLKIYKLTSFLRFDYLTDITGVDFLGKKFIYLKDRYTFFYFMSSMMKPKKSRLSIKFSSSEHAPVYSIFDLFHSANWAEREIWDLFGKRFITHPDLRRILNDYGFRGFPLRKDYPTIGFKQVKFDELQNSVVYEDLFLTQDERELFFKNSWVIESSFIRTIRIKKNLIPYCNYYEGCYRNILKPIYK